MRNAIGSRWGGLGVAAAGVLLSCAAQAEILEEIVVRVNDAIITRSELEKRRTQTAARLQATVQGEELQRALSDAQDRLLLDMINEELLLQQAELNFDMNKYYERLRRDFMRVNEINTEAELGAMLEKEGMDLEDFRKLLLRNNVPPDVIQFEVTRKLSVSPQEVREYYDSHQEDFSVPGEVRLREIVILDQQRGAAAAKAVVDQIQARLAAGETFEALAREHSESPSRSGGGLVGPYRKGDLAPALETQAFSLQVGGVGEPIATSYGFHLIQVESRTETAVSKLEDVRDTVEDRVRREKFDRELNAYLTRLWTENNVVLNPRYATGALEDGGPYTSREALLPEANPLGPPATPPGGIDGR